MTMRFGLLILFKVFVAGLFNQKYFGYTDDDIYNKVSYLKVRKELS